MATLHEALDDLVAQVPAHVVAPDIAARAWAAGRRRRWRQRAAGTALVALLTAVLVATVPPLADGVHPLAAADSEVSGYPQRLGHQWWVRTLPDRPGPMAALAQIGERWYAVSPRGHRWRLPTDLYGDFPTISPDGRYVGYLVDRDGPYVLHDLVTGEKVEFPEIGAGMGMSTETYRIHLQFPSFWSPAGTQVVMSGVVPHGTSEVWGVLVLGIDGSLTAMATQDEGHGHPAGWASDDAILMLGWTFDAGWAPMDVTITAVGLDGQVRWGRPLRPAGDWQGLNIQWSGVVSPDRSRLLVADRKEYGGVVLRQFSVASGAELAAPVTVDDWSVCGPGWAGSAPVVPFADDSWEHATLVIEAGEPRPILLVEPGLGSECLVWASDALAATPHGGLFGIADGWWMVDAWWTWWYREIALALLLAAGGAVTLLLRRRIGPPIPSRGASTS